MVVDRSRNRGLRRNYTGRRLALAALVIGLGIGGCGSSSSKPKLTKDQFLSQANAICSAGNAKTNAQGQALGPHPSQASATRVVQTQFVPEIQTEINSIRALAVQTADKSKLTSMLNLAQSGLNDLKANPALIAANANSSPFHDFAAQAHPYGLTQCAPTS